VRPLRLSPGGDGYGGGVATLTINVFNVTNRCPVCGGAANSRYHNVAHTRAGQMKRKCTDCGYTWDEAPVARTL
jgi:hypothetical protein